MCNEPGKAIQIHHIDEDASNHEQNNLAVLCLQHHEETQLRGGFGKKLREVDVRRYRDDWLKRVAERRAAADKILLGRLTVIPVVDKDNWVQPSNEVLAVVLNTLPVIYADIYGRAEPSLSSVVRNDMLHGLQMIIDVLAQSWVSLSAWFPPRHFGNVSADEYFSKFISDRYNWNLALWEPRGPGSGGREAAIFAHLSTKQDVERSLMETVRQLGMWLEDFDFDAWEMRWRAVWRQGERG